MKTLSAICALAVILTALAVFGVPQPRAAGYAAGPGTRSSSLQGWDCVYDVQNLFPNQDTKCPWAWTLAGGSASFADYGDVLIGTMPGSAGPLASRTPTFDLDRGWILEMRLTVKTIAGHVPSNSSYRIVGLYRAMNTNTLEQWGFQVWINDANWKVDVRNYTGWTPPDFSVGHFPQIFTYGDYHTFRFVTPPCPDGSGRCIYSGMRMPMKFFVDGVYKGTTDDTWYLPPNYIDMEMRNWYFPPFLQDWAEFDWDWWAYKLSYQDPSTLPAYPLPHVNPRPYPAGLRDGALTPYWSWIYDWQDHDSVTPASFYLPYSTTETGTVEARHDVLYLNNKAADSTTTLYVNDTKNTASTADDTAMYSSAAALGYLDLLHDASVTHAGSTLRGENITIEDGASPNFATDRASEIQISRSFNWSWDGGTNTYDFTLLLTNAATRTWWNAWFSVPFIPGTAADPNSVTVFDQANNQYLTSGLNFLVTGGSVEFEVTNIGAGLSRTWDLKYSPVARAEFSVIRLDLTQATPDNTFAGAAYKGRVTTTLSSSQTFSGDIMIVFNVADPSFAGQIVDLTSVTIVNVRMGTRVANWFPHPTQANIVVLPNQDIPAGAVQSYDVYFAYRSGSAGGVGDFLGSELGAIVVVILLILVLVFGIDNARMRRRRDGA